MNLIQRILHAPSIISDLSAQLDQCKSRCDTLQTRVIETGTRAESDREALETAGVRIVELERRLAECTAGAASEDASDEREIARLTDQLAEARDQIAVTEDAIEALEHELGQLQVTEPTRSLYTLQQQRGRDLAEIARLTHELEETKSELFGYQDGACNDLNAQDDVIRELQGTEAFQLDIITKQRQAIESLTGEIETLRSEARLDHVEIVQRHDELEYLRDQLADLSDAADLQRRLTTAELTAIALRQELETARGDRPVRDPRTGRFAKPTISQVDAAKLVLEDVESRGEVPQQWLRDLAESEAE